LPVDGNKYAGKCLHVKWQPSQQSGPFITPRTRIFATLAIRDATGAPSQQALSSGHQYSVEDASMTRSEAEILREYGPFPDVDHVRGVSFDGRQVWFASGDKLNAFDPEGGKVLRAIDVAADAGTAFDGEHLFQLAEGRIQKIDPNTGRVLATIPAPGGGAHSGLAWAEGSLWVGQYRERKIHQIDPETGATLRTIESNRFVTGVTWVDGELWHGTWEGDESDVRRLDPRTGEALEQLAMPPGVVVSGLESDGRDQFFCGGGTSGKVRVVRRPKRGSATVGGAETQVDPAGEYKSK
jgi:hypothetical protein